MAFASVTGLSGRADKIAGWVKQAWINIQNERADWRWMTREFTGNIVANTSRYAGTAFGLTRVAAWKVDTPEEVIMSLYDPAIGARDEGTIVYEPFSQWRASYGRGAHDAQRPTVWSIDHQNNLCLGATPDQSYTLRGLYRVTPQELVASGDVPEMPERFHRVIVFEAIRLMSNSDEAAVTTVTSTADMQILKQALVRDQIETPGLDSGGGGPLA